MNFDQHAVMSYNLREMAQDIPISQWQHYRMDELDQFENCLHQSGCVSVNITLDESERPWLEKYDPDLDILFGKYGLPSDLFHGVEPFNNPENAHQTIRHFVECCLHEQEDPETVLGDLKQRHPIRLSFFSKTKFPQHLSDDQLLSHFKARFIRSVPLTRVDLVLVTGI